MGAENINAGDEISELQDSCFFAYLDILGFKAITERSSFDRLKAIVGSFVDSCSEAIDRSRRFETNAGRVYGRLDIGSNDDELDDSEPRIKVRIVSDSIYIWTKNDDGLKQFDDLLRIVNAMLASGFKHGLLLRGVVTFGELFEDNSKISADIPMDAGAIYGRALVEAYELESQMDWSGAILTPKAWAKVKGEFEKAKVAGVSTVMRSGNIKAPTDLFNHFPYLLWCDVPFKGNNRRKAIAFNWNYKSGLDLSEEKIHEAFLVRGDVEEQSVRSKLNETIRFYEYAQRVAELCDFGLKKELPVPDSTYILSVLP